MRAADREELAKFIDDARSFVDAIHALATVKPPLPASVAAIARAANSELEAAAAILERPRD